MDAGGRYLWSVARRLRWTILGRDRRRALLAGRRARLAAARPPRGRRRHRPPPPRRAVVGVRRDRRARARRSRRGRRAALLRDPEPGARRRRCPRRDLPARARARRALPRPRRRGRADLARVERRRARRPRLRRDRSHGRLHPHDLRRLDVLFVVDWRSRWRCSRRSRSSASASAATRRRYAERTKVNQEELGELTALAEETIPASASSRGSAPATRSRTFPRPLRPRGRELARRCRRRRGLPTGARGITPDRRARRALVRRTSRHRW